MKEFEGVYRGFSPLFTGLGEVEVRIADGKIKVLTATDSGVGEQEFETNDFVQMTPEEVRFYFDEKELAENDEFLKRAVGFVYVFEAAGHPKMIFLRNASADEYGLLVITPITWLFGLPVVLFNPEQIQRGDFKKAVAELEGQTGHEKFFRLNDAAMS